MERYYFCNSTRLPGGRQMKADDLVPLDITQARIQLWLNPPLLGKGERGKPICRVATSAEKKASAKAAKDAATKAEKAASE